MKNLHLFRYRAPTHVLRALPLPIQWPADSTSWRIFYSLFYGEPPEDLGVWRALGTFVFLLGALILIVYVLLPALGL